MPLKVIEPAYPKRNAEPNSRNADENDPRRKYFRAASWLSSLRLRARPTSR